MKRELMAAVLASVMSIASGGCATILNDDTRLVTIQSNPPGAQIVVDGVPAGVTPATIPVSNSDDHHIVINGPGGAQGCFLESHVGAGWVVLDIILLPLLVPIIVDAITGEWASLGQTACYVNMGPPPAVPPPTQPPGAPPGA